MADRRSAPRPRHPAPAPRDRVGLGRVLPGRLLPGLVAAMAFLAALALAGVFGAAQLAGRWSTGAASMVTVQVPQPDDAAAPPAAGGGAAGTRVQAVVAALQADRTVVKIHRLNDDELTQLLRPWLSGDDGTRDGASLLGSAIALPAVIEVTLRPGAAPTPDETGRLQALASGTLWSRDDGWGARLATLAASLQACAGLALLTVAGVAASVVAVAARAGLGARRQTIEIVHGLGASHGDIAGRFAGRASLLAACGAVVGALLALPVLLTLAWLAAPFSGTTTILPSRLPSFTPSRDSVLALVAWSSAVCTTMPTGLWLTLALLPCGAAAIGWVTTQLTVRRWLRRL